MVLMSLFAGQRWRRRCGDWSCGHEEGVGGIERVTPKRVHCHV